MAITITIEKPLKSPFSNSFCVPHLFGICGLHPWHHLSLNKMFLKLMASTWEDQLLTSKTRVHQINKKAVSHFCKCFYSLRDVYEANTTRQCYHEGQWGEEEADDQFDVWLVAYHLPQSLAEGNELGFFPRGLYRPTRRIREESETRGIHLVRRHCTVCCHSDLFPENIQGRPNVSKGSDSGAKSSPFSCHSSIPFCSFTPRNNTAAHRT